MQYTITINQTAAIRMGLDVDVIDLSIFDYIQNIANSGKCEKLQTNGDIYFCISHKSLIQQLPILGITTGAGIIKRINKLIDAGLLERHPNCEMMHRTFYKFGPKYDDYYFYKENDNESFQPSTNVEGTLNESFLPSTKVFYPQRKFSTLNERLGYQSTMINNNNIINKEKDNINIIQKEINKENPIESLFPDEDIKPKRFIKPTIEQIRLYCKERNNGIDAQGFFDYYESVGWKVGNKPMKDWRAAVRTWERNRKPDKPQPQQTQLTIEDEFSKFGEQAEFMRQYVAKERADKQREIDRYIKRNMDKMKQEQNDNNDE